MRGKVSFTPIRLIFTSPRLEMKIPCADCGALILRETAERNGGLCMPCKAGTRANIESSKIAAKRSRELDANDPFRIYWRRLVDVVYETPGGLSSLSELDLQYWGVGCLSGEVYNGGFEQYFNNSSGKTYRSAKRGLEAMGALTSRDLLQSAKQAVFGSGAVPEDTAVRRTVLAAVQSEALQQRLDELDKQFWADPDKLSELSEAFAIRHGLVQTDTPKGD